MLVNFTMLPFFPIIVFMHKGNNIDVLFLKKVNYNYVIYYSPHR